MKKKNFVSLILGTVGGILFALGMCMVLLPAWEARSQGVAMGAAGALLLLAIAPVRRRMEGLPLFVWNGKTLGTTLLGVAGVLALGVGMCMTMVWDMLVPGILVGILGIVLLLCLIPAIKGLE